MRGVTTLEYSQATKEGTAHVAIRRDGARVASASARLKADTQELAAAAPSALLLYLTGRPARPGMKCQDIDEGGGRGLQCQDIKTDGNVRVLLEQADKIIDWWDAQASLTHPGYVSPRPNPDNLGRLHFNIWGHRSDSDPGWNISSVIVLFDPTDPTKVVGGTIRYLAATNCLAASRLLMEPSQRWSTLRRRVTSF